MASAAAKVFEQIRIMADVHDRDADPVPPYSPCPMKLKALGVRMSYYDMERLGWEEGDVVYPSKDLRLEAGGMFGNIRLICDCERSSPTADDAEVKIGSGIGGGVADREDEHDSELVKADGEVQRNKDLVTV